MPPPPDEPAGEHTLSAFIRNVAQLGRHRSRRTAGFDLSPRDDVVAQGVGRPKHSFLNRAES